jgi:SAM-dependent methyltransferase
MRICVLQSTYPDQHELAEHDSGADPSRFTDQHTFELRWIRKDSAKEQIDAVISEKFDFYFNLMWGQLEDEVAGIEACEYFESFGLPAIGQRSEVLKRTKNDFYRNARVLGAPRVPGTSNYPLFVKPSQSCSSQFITNKSLCRNREELLESLKDLNHALDPGRKIAGRSGQPVSTSTVVDGIAIPDDIVVQEFIQGWDHSVPIIEVGDCPVPLTPHRYVYPQGFVPYDDFLRFNIKFHEETNIKLLDRKEEPELFTKLQEMAVQAWKANQMAGQSWANVDLRVQANGEPVVIEVNPMPAVFLPDEKWEDVAVRESFPGGHRALVNVLIASHLIRRKVEENRQSRIADIYTTYSKTYDESIARFRLISIYERIISLVDLSGSILELGSGTGVFGRLLEKKSPPPSHETTTLTGIELSKGMIEKCQETGLYKQVYHGSMQTIFPSMGPFDHIVSFGTLCYASPEDFSLIMARSFQLARKSIAVTIDEITDEYNQRLRELNDPNMTGYNNKAEMEKTFCNPPPAGWKLSETFREFGWSSPHVQSDIFVTSYIFERVEGD